MLYSIEQGYISRRTMSRFTLNSQMKRALQVWDVVVVGAGVAGSALAYSQGRVRPHIWPFNCTQCAR
jgi:hypothetical protein